MGAVRSNPGGVPDGIAGAAVACCGACNGLKAGWSRSALKSDSRVSVDAGARGKQMCRYSRAGVAAMPMLRRLTSIEAWYHGHVLNQQSRRHLRRVQPVRASAPLPPGPAPGDRWHATPAHARQYAVHKVWFARPSHHEPSAPLTKAVRLLSSGRRWQAPAAFARAALTLRCTHLTTVPSSVSLIGGRGLPTAVVVVILELAHAVHAAAPIVHEAVVILEVVVVSEEVLVIVIVIFIVRGIALVLRTYMMWLNCVMRDMSASTHTRSSAW